MSIITITDDNGHTDTYHVDGKIIHRIDQFHSHGMFGINFNEHRRLHTIQFTTGKEDA